MRFGIILLFIFQGYLFSQSLPEKFRSADVFALELTGRANEMVTQINQLIPWEQKEFALSAAYEQGQNANALAADCSLAAELLQGLLEDLRDCAIAQKLLAESQGHYKSAGVFFKYVAEDWQKVRESKNKKQYVTESEAAQESTLSAQVKIQDAQQSLENAFNAYKKGCF